MQLPIVQHPRQHILMAMMCFLVCHPAQVIISLQEGRGHVPYRNSLLTMVLRDSLGEWVGGGLVEDQGLHGHHI